MEELTIELVEVTKRFDRGVALRNINVEVRRGEFLVLLGPSGCGKSTILKIIAGLEDATEGEVYIDGHLANYLAPKDRNIAMVFQNYALYPHMTVEGNIGYPLKMRGTPKQQTRTKVVEVARLLEIEGFLARYPDQLSGGQRQRVALGRALIRDPIAFLLDEPLSNLDALLRAQMRDELLKFHRRIGRTTVYVTHDQVEAMTMADRIVVLKEGVIQQIGSPEDVYMRSANAFVGTFVGSPQMNLVPGTITAGGDEFVFKGPFNLWLGNRFPAPAKASNVSVGIRPEHIVVANDHNERDLLGNAVLVELVGADILLDVKVAEGVFLKVRAPASLRIHEGDSVRLRVRADDVHLFDTDGLRVLPLRESAEAPPRSRPQGAST